MLKKNHWEMFLQIAKKMKRNKEYLPIGKDKRFNTYHDEVDRLTLNSQILNSGSEKPSIHTKFWDKHSIECEIYTMLGNENGLYLKDKDVFIAFIPGVKMKLEELQEKFLKYKKNQIEQGKNEPSEMPAGMLTERLLLEAKLLVFEEELAELQKRLKTFSDKDKEISDSKILQYGPIGQGKLNDGILSSIDGMHTKEIKTDKGFVLIIDEDHLKAKDFNGYSTADYLQFIVEPWKRLCAEQSEINKIQAKKDGVKYEMLSNGLRRGTNAKVPEMPREITNYKHTVLERTK
jgi:hypothetical protein